MRNEQAGVSSANYILKKARELVAGGWAGPEDFGGMCRDSNGKPCGEWDEGVAQFSVLGAIRLAGKNDMHGRVAAWRTLDQVVDFVGWSLEEFFAGSWQDNLQRALELTNALLTKGPHTEDWLSNPKRTLPEVLRMFDKAIARAK
jgi:hypothetical protein